MEFIVWFGLVFTIFVATSVTVIEFVKDRRRSRYLLGFTDIILMWFASFGIATIVYTIMLCFAWLILKLAGAL